MTDEQMNVYKMRIAQSGIGDLTVVMLEMEMQWIEDALQAFENRKIEEFVDCVGKAQAVQIELMNVLNMKNAIAVDVYSVFSFINRQLIQAKIKRAPMDLARCKKMLEAYHSAFVKVAKTDQEGPVMAGSEKIYAGYTYGAGGLVENSLGGHEFSV